MFGRIFGLCNGDTNLEMGTVKQLIEDIAEAQEATHRRESLYPLCTHLVKVNTRGLNQHP
jgi:hypothetical protein